MAGSNYYVYQYLLENGIPYLNRYKDPEYKSKISAGLKGKPWSEARRNAYLQSKALKGL